MTVRIKALVNKKVRLQLLDGSRKDWKALSTSRGFRIGNFNRIYSRTQKSKWLYGVSVWLEHDSSLSKKICCTRFPSILKLGYWLPRVQNWRGYFLLWKAWHKELTWQGSFHACFSLGIIFTIKFGSMRHVSMHNLQQIHARLIRLIKARRQHLQNKVLCWRLSIDEASSSTTNMDQSQQEILSNMYGFIRLMLRSEDSSSVYEDESSLATTITRLNQVRFKLADTMCINCRSKVL